jgi:hypothetical protein
VLVVEALILSRAKVLVSAQLSVLQVWDEVAIVRLQATFALGVEGEEVPSAIEPRSFRQSAEAGFACYRIWRVVQEAVLEQLPVASWFFFVRTDCLDYPFSIKPL